MPSPLCHLSANLEPVGLSTIHKSFIRSCLEHGHLCAAKSHLDRLDALQLKLLAFVIALAYRLLDEGHGDFIPGFVTTATRISSHLPRYRLTLPGHLD